MPESKPNPIARVLAVIALVVGFLLVVITIATSGGGGDDGDDGSDGDEQAESAGPTAKGERALEEGVWLVEEGDTLVSISEETGVDLDELVELNTDIDPQALITGQRISLREGAVPGPDTDAGASPGADATGVGDEGPTGSGTTDGLDTD
jgi:hypothetical protein